MDVTSISTPAIGNSTLQSEVKSAVELQKPQQKDLSVETQTLKAQQATKQEALEQVEKVNSRLEQLGMGISFSVDESTQSSVIKVIDRSTDEIIKQFPNEGSLQMMKNIQSYLDSVQQSSTANKESLTGVLFSEII